ncbi:MAG TPA: hypothetical protein VFD03_06785 [Clostridia bacterium]|nr:hypothetical protein [Clostridia bacterium]
MKSISIDKLNKFVLQEGTDSKMKKPLQEIHTTEEFSVASNSYMVAIVYNSEDHGLNHTFGDCMDSILSIVKKSHNSAYDDYQIIFNRKELLDLVTEQFRKLKALVKQEQKKITLHENEAITRIDIDCNNHKMYVQTYTKVKYGGTGYVVTGQDIDVGFKQSKWKALNSWKSGYSSQYLLDTLKFMTGYEQLTFYARERSINPVRCEEVDREMFLLPFHIDD